MLPGIVRRQDEYEKIAFEFGRLGFPPGEQPSFKIKKRSLMYLGELGVCQGQGLHLDISIQYRRMPCLELYWALVFLLADTFSRILWAHVLLFSDKVWVCQEAKQSSHAPAAGRHP